MQKLDAVEAYLCQLPGCEKSFPFDAVTAVYKVGGKMFALCSTDQTPLRINLKADPEDALLQREQFPAISPGYHMNKDHWNTVVLDGSLPPELVQQLILDSYHLIVKKLPKRLRPPV